MSNLLIYKITDATRMVRYVITEDMSDAKAFLENHENDGVRLKPDEYIDGCYSADGFLSEQLGDRVVFALEGLE
jgi:hypothetical protein